MRISFNWQPIDGKTNHNLNAIQHKPFPAMGDEKQ